MRMLAYLYQQHLHFEHIAFCLVPEIVGFLILSLHKLLALATQCHVVAVDSLYILSIFVLICRKPRKCVDLGGHGYALSLKVKRSADDLMS